MWPVYPFGTLLYDIWLEAKYGTPNLRKINIAKSLLPINPWAVQTLARK
jgi:hypothetical protein